MHIIQRPIMFVLPTSILYVSPQPPPQVHITDLIMRGNSAQQKRMVPVVDFVQTTMKDSNPANFFVLVDSHSDANTGCIQHCGGTTGGISSPIDTVSDLHLFTLYLVKRYYWQVLKGYLGQDCSMAAATASVLGRQLGEDPTLLQAKAPGIKFRNTGGLRGLFLMTCGPAMTNRYHFLFVSTLVFWYVLFRMGAN